ncbi:MAG: ROK family protein, partial [Cellvibrio sp.]|uniref:ROK family protein n=1 Tax=Cellvibrio sp. TaxID=1965322 RepID=UPI00271A9EBF|nr:ROK family protein [Cellvibrio sp.]
LVMGTRSGDIDAGVLQYLHNTCGMSLEEIMNMLNKRSGLLGLSNQSNDMRSLCKLARDGDAQAALAIEVFCYRLAKYIAAYSVALERLDAIVFTGGIGENARPVRARVAALLKNLGVSLSDELNQENGDPRGVISSPQSRIPLLVIPTQEELMIARATFSSI